MVAVGYIGAGLYALRPSGTGRRSGKRREGGDTIWCPMEGTYLLGWESKQQTVCHPVARWQKPDSDGSKRLSMRVKVLGGNLVHPSLARHQKTAWAQGNQHWRRTEVLLGIARSVELHDAQPLWSSATNPSCCRGKGHKLHCCTTAQLYNCTTAVIPTSSSRSVPACAEVYHQLERQCRGRKKLPFCAETSECRVLTMGDHPLIPDPARQGKVLQGFSKSGGTSFPLS